MMMHRDITSTPGLLKLLISAKSVPEVIFYCLKYTLSLPVALHVGLRPCEIFPVNVGMSAGIIIIQVFFR